MGFRAARCMLMEQRALLSALENPAVDSWVGLAHLKLYGEIGYLLWKNLIAHSRAPQPICVPQPILAREDSSPEV